MSFCQPKREHDEWDDGGGGDGYGAGGVGGEFSFSGEGFGDKRDAEDDAENFMHFENPAAAYFKKRNKRRRGAPSDEPDGASKRVDTPKEYVAIDDLRRKSRRKLAEQVLARRDQALSVASRGLFEEDNAEDDEEEAGAVVGRGAHKAELVAAELDENVMYYSSCSDDEEVLKFELVKYGHTTASVEQRRAETGSSSHCGRDHVPSGARLFDEPDAVLPDADSSSERQPSNEAAQWAESVESKRARIVQLRQHVHRERRRRGVVADECFKCMWGNARYDAVYAKPLHQCFALMEQEIGRRELRAVAKTVHEFFKHAIYLPMLRSGRQVPMWRTRTIYEHLMEHECEPRIQLYRQLRTLNTLQSVLIDETHVRDPTTDKVRPDVPTIRALLDVIKLSQQLSTVNPKQMVFYDDKSALNLGSATSQNAASTGSLTVRGRFVMSSQPVGKLYM